MDLDEDAGRDARDAKGDDGIGRDACPRPDEESRIGGARHLVWHVEVLGDRYRLSWVEAAFDTGEPELMAFREDPDGEVSDWDEVASSYEPDPVRAYAEVMTRLRAWTSGRLMDEL